MICFSWISIKVIFFPPVLSLSPIDKSIISGSSTPLFSEIRTHHILTVSLHVPNGWLVRTKESIYDLDNLRPPNLDEHQKQNFNTRFVLSAIFILSDIFIEGQVFATQRIQQKKKIIYKNKKYNRENNYSMPVIR